MLTILTIVVSIIAGALLMTVIMLLLQRGSKNIETRMEREVVAERVRAVGKLIGLEVHAKEIVTSKKGWSWMPPLLLSQAKVAMIFHFDKQYYIDLSRLRAADVEEASPGFFRVALPPIEGNLRLTDVTPYDIQAGRILGLLDVIQMNAETQKSLMQSAQEQAAALFDKSEHQYLTDARRSIERHLDALLEMFDVRIEIIWSDQDDRGERMEVEENLSRKLVGV
ncbi:MAG: DUF4230 domain-containing protein [Phycisphaerales bacterium]|nr:DUF4230 domain-containing protein [Phycisphaerales bacterium]